MMYEPHGSRKLPWGSYYFQALKNVFVSIRSREIPCSVRNNSNRADVLKDKIIKRRIICNFSLMFPPKLPIYYSVKSNTADIGSNVYPAA